MLIIAALSIEIAPLINTMHAEKVKAYSNKTALYRSNGHDLLVTGVGPVMAQRTLTAYLKDHRPDFILNIGTAGMLLDKMELGKIHHIAETLTEDEAPIRLHMLIDGPGEACLSVRRDIDNRERRDRTHHQYRARLADMECYTFASIAESEGIPMSAIKITTDFADCDTRDMFRKQVETSANKLAEEVMLIIKP
jgi:nucleoside phosphorylase